MKRLVFGLAVIGASALATSAGAVPLVYEGFDYAAGETLAGKNGGTGWRVGESGGATWDNPNGSASAWGGNASVATGGLTYTDSQGNALETSGNSHLVVTGGSTSANRMFRENRPIPDTATFWISVLAQRTGNANAEAIGFLQHSGWGGDVRFFGQTRDGNDWRLQGGSASGDVSGALSFLLIKWDRVSNAASLWVNPRLDGEGNLGAADSTATWTPGDDLRRIEFRADSGAGLLLDEYRMGTTFADVTPFVVPEPASLAMIALGGLACAARRRA